MIFTRKILRAVGAGAVFLAPLIAFAADEFTAIDTPQKVIAAICKFSNWLFGALLALAVVFIIYAAFLFLTAGDDAEKVGKAKKQLIYAVIAVAVATLSIGIINLTQMFLGTPTGVGC